MRWRISPCVFCFTIFTIRFLECEDLNSHTPCARSRLFFVDASGKFLAATSIHVLWFSYPVILHLNRSLFTRPTKFFAGTLPIFSRPLSVSLICKWSFSSFVAVNVEQRDMMLVKNRKWISLVITVFIKLWKNFIYFYYFFFIRNYEFCCKRKTQLKRSNV